MMRHEDNRTEEFNWKNESHLPRSGRSHGVSVEIDKKPSPLQVQVYRVPRLKGLWCADTS